MGSLPKEWDENTKGGYLFSDYNELSKNTEIVKSNPYLKTVSEISKDKIETVNYLSRIPFVINKSMLNYLIEDWKKDISTMFKDKNKLHPLTTELS